MQIQKQICFCIAGKTFGSPKKAFQHVEDLIAEHVRKVVISTDGCPYKVVIPLTEYILEHREELAQLLSVKPYQEELEED